ncbi:BUB3.2 [Symbiodinium sp. KB8]|nr:BUB3.2 [Symbiodinium sp. KB8]
MLRDIIAALLPLAGSVSYNSPRLAELVLLVLISFSVGFCCGGILVCFLVSAHCRAGVSRLLLAFLEGQLPEGSAFRVRISSREVLVEVTRAAAEDRHDEAESGEWEVVEAPSLEAPSELELVVATGPAPLHLVRRSRLSTVGGWSPEDRIRRAYQLGQGDCQAALDSSRQAPRDSFRVASSVYVILYDPNGHWPRFTRNLQRFYEATKAHSEGFPSLVEGEAYVLGDGVDLLCLKWPTGVILAVPGQAISAEQLEEADDTGHQGLIGPNQIVMIRQQDSPEDSEELLEVLMIEFGMDIHRQLEKRTPRSRRAIKGFVEDVGVLPSFTELNTRVEAWLEGGDLRLEEYFSAQEEAGQAKDQRSNDVVLQHLQALKASLDQRFGTLEAAVHKLEERPQQDRGPPKQGPSDALPSRAAGSRQQEIDRLVGEAQRQVRRPPRRTPDEPGREAETAIDVEMLRPNGEESKTTVDDMMKLALVQLLQDKAGKNKKKNKRLPGLGAWDDNDSDSEMEESGGWSSSSKGGRGIEAVERLWSAMRNNPEPYQERMEQRMLKAVEESELTPNVPLLFAKSCPVGKSRTAGYCLQGFAHVHRLLLENKPKQARLQVLRMMASIEQFLIDESWTVAGRMTGMEEPPWGHWATQDLGSLRRQYVYTRLVESTWVAALINELKEEEWLVKKRTGLAKPPKGKGEGKDTAKDFDPRPFLSPVFRHLYEKPDDFLKPSDEQGPPFPAKGTATRDQLLKVFERWDRLGRLFICKAQDVSPLDRCELFAVAKDAEKDRQILHRKRRNLREVHVVGASKDLPHGVLLCQLPLEDRFLCASSVDDVKDFYHAYSASEDRARSSPVGPIFRDSEVRHLASYENALRNGRIVKGDRVACCFQGLGMGDHAAVDIAQESHVNLVSSMRATLEQPARDLEAFASAEKAYAAANLEAHPKKRQRRLLGLDPSTSTSLKGRLKRRSCWVERAVLQVRERGLLERGRITERTHKIRQDLLLRLEDWLGHELPEETLENLARHHIDSLCEWLEEYMIYMFVNKQSRRSAAETLNAVTQKFGWLRSSLAGPWNVLRTWEGLEPVEHHPPIPVQVLRALVCTALAWGWQRVAVLLALGFFGLLRPSEAIGLRRQDVSLPSDHVSGDLLFLRLGSPKTRHRGARHQHVRVDEPGLASWIDLKIGSLPLWSRLWSGSWAAFRRRFELLQREVLGSRYFLPSSLRPGGATYLFRLWDENLVRLQWRGRWRSYHMLEIYVQELGAAEVLIRFPLRVRHRVGVLGSLFARILDACRQPVGTADCLPSHPPEKVKVGSRVTF